MEVYNIETFSHYKISQTEDGLEVILYVNENTTEFSAELGTLSRKESNITNEAIHFIKRKLPLLKIKTCKIMAGGMLLSVLGIGALPTQKAAAAKNTVTQSQTNHLTYKVLDGDTLYSIAQQYNTTVDAIKQANRLSSNLLQIGQELIIPYGATSTPTYTREKTYTVVSGDTLYSIADRNGTTVDAIKQANNLNSNVLSIGQTLTIPSGGSTVPTQKNGTSYTVVSGDTLYSIADRYGTTVGAIKQDNNLTSNILNIGQTLSIPAGSGLAPTQKTGTSYTVVSGDTLYSIADRYGTTVDAIKQDNNLTSNILNIGQTLSIPAGGGLVPTQKTGTSYTVVSGDTLYSIADRNGTSVDAIKQANKLTSNNLSIGQTLTIPSSQTTVAPASPKFAAEHHSVVDQEELEWLAKMIYSEARGESLEGQIAVGAVIMNRVKSPLFPNTVKEVIFEKSYGYYQFTPAQNGAIHEADPGPQQMEAAKRAMNGEDPTNGALFFYNPDKTSSTYLRSLEVSTKIGNHVFAF